MKLLTIALAGLAGFATLVSGAPSSDAQLITRSDEPPTPVKAPFTHIDTDKLRQANRLFPLSLNVTLTTPRYHCHGHILKECKPGPNICKVTEKCPKFCVDTISPEGAVCADQEAGENDSIGVVKNTAGEKYL